jgi:nucleoside-diphosphate-sugar epimerase
LNQKISVLGCGWLGFPLAEELVRQGYVVKGSTTTPQKLPRLEAFGIRPFRINLENLEITPETKAFFQTETLIINVPPRRGEKGNYALQIRNLAQLLTQMPVKKVLFVSSTGVYASSEFPITETSPLDPENSSELIQAEQAISAVENPWQTTIVRFAGLFGPDREPGRFLAGKINLPAPDAPVNLIHLQDCIQILTAIIKQSKWGEIYNACADKHPSRQEFYTAAAVKLHLPEPQFASEVSTDKKFRLISNQKLKSDLQYSFTFPDPKQAN